MVAGGAGSVKLDCVGPPTRCNMQRSRHLRLTSADDLCDTAATMLMRSTTMSMSMPMGMRVGVVRAVEG